MNNAMRNALLGVDMTPDQRAYAAARVACFAEGPAQLRSEHYVRIERDLDELEESAVRFVQTAMNDTATATIDAVGRLFDSRAADVLGKVNRFEVRSGALQLAVTDAMRMTFELGGQHAREELSTTVAEFARRYPRPSVSDKAAIEYLEAKAVAASRKLADRLDAEVKQVLLNAVRTGETRADTIDKLANVFAGYGGRPAAFPTTGGVPPSLAQIKTIVRTTMTDAYNHGRIVKFINARTVKGVMYSAVMDSRTTEICAQLHERTVPIDHERLHEIIPPNHFNCRSILLPVRRNEPMLRQVSNDLFNDIAVAKAKIGWT